MIKTPLSTVIGGAFWTPGATVINGAKLGFETIIKKLFTNNEQGFFYDPNDLSTMFQDAAGTVPVTAAGQPVGLIKDKSGRGKHAVQTTSASRPILRQNAITKAYYLEFDGVDDYLQVDNAALPSPLTTLFAVDQSAAPYAVLLSTGAAGYINLTTSGVGFSGNKSINRKTPKDVVTFRFVGGNLSMRTSVAEGSASLSNAFTTASTKYIGVFDPTGTVKFNGSFYGVVAITKNMPIIDENYFRALFNKRMGV